jgi:hypothetical protein
MLAKKRILKVLAVMIKDKNILHNFASEGKFTDKGFVFKSLEGEETAPIDSVLIRGIDGELYAISKEKFSKKYDFNSNLLNDGKVITATTKADSKEIEVIKFENIESALKFIGNNGYKNSDDSITIKASWGNLKATPGCYIAKYSDNDYAPIASDIFEKTYIITKK